MLTVKRYWNGVPIEKSDLKKIVIDSPVICQIIDDVNRRLSFFNGQGFESDKAITLAKTASGE